MKEYGGFLPLELADGEDYFDRYANKFKIKKLNCGRSTFWYAMKLSKAKKIYVPYLNCADSVVPFERLGIPYEFYCLSDELLPLNISPKKGEALLWINYYGNASDEKIDFVCEKYKEAALIIDHCHAFFAAPRHGAYNCYSARKFFGVCDGAYLLSDFMEEFGLVRSVSAGYYEFILESIECGTNFVYDKNLMNEKRLGLEEPQEMSVLTEKILKSIDYDRIREIRNTNLKFIHDRLGEINLFNVNIEANTQMYYPLFVKKEGLRERLIARKIYTPTWWRHVSNYFETPTVETELAKYMLMIPIDQRYTTIQMGEITDIILEEYWKLS